MFKLLKTTLLTIMPPYALLLPFLKCSNYIIFIPTITKFAVPQIILQSTAVLFMGETFMMYNIPFYTCSEK